MSHTMTVSAVQRKREGRPLYRSKEALFRACEQLGLSCNWVKDHRIATAACTGWAVQLPGWFKVVVFEAETPESELKGTPEVFDNYSPYTEDHVAVRKGEKRVGEDGQWGDIQELWKLDEAYVKEVNKLLRAELLAEAAEQQDMVKELACHNDGERIELLWIQD